MKMMKRSSVCAMLFTIALSVPVFVFAQSPFDGTWHTNLNQAKFSPKPVSFYIGDGWYHCITCNPEVVAKADGEDHAVTGQAYDTISIKEVDPKTIETVTKKGSTVITDQTRTVSANGKVLTVKTTYHPMDGSTPVTAEVTATRTGIPPSGVQATSGSWKIDKAKQSENGLAVTYKFSGDEFTMSDPTGVTYTAKFDGKDYPVKGAYGFNEVSLKKIDAHTIEETDKRGDTVIAVLKMTVSPDGKKMSVVDTNKLTDRTSTYTATK